MPVLKAVRFLLPAATIDMGGFPVKQPLPTQKVQQVDPFLLLHHAKTKYSNRRPARVQGVGPHPHRGFSPVTFVVEGEVHHRDSRGNSQIARAGEVQWMHSGAGIIHSERPSEALVQGSRRQEIVQLWINSPAAKKWEQPLYQHVTEAEMPEIPSEDGKIRIKLIAGEAEGKRGKIHTQSPLLVLWGSGEQTGKQTLQVSAGFNAVLYQISGSIRLTGYGLVQAEHLVVFGEEGEALEMTVEEAGQFLVLCGEPINEEVTQHGPYVMNTQTEILEAMRDYQMGKMGILIEADFP